MSLIADIVLRSSVLLMLGLAAREALRRRSAAVRHFVLATSMIAAAVVVPLSFVLPVWSVRTVSVPSVIPQVSPQPSSSATVVVAEHRARPRVSAVSFVVIIWGGGAALGMATLVAGLTRLARITAGARRQQENRWARLTRELSAVYSINREIGIFQTTAPDLLATWGWLRRASCSRPARAVGPTIGRALCSVMSWRTSGATTGSCRSARSCFGRSSGSTR